MKTVIFDLDGTLADITKRREMSTKENGKIDWDIFFEPNNIWFDTPNEPVIEMAKILSQKNRIVIFSGRSKATKTETKRWLQKFDVPFDCYKYISDSDADGEDQGAEWAANVHKGAEQFRRIVLEKQEIVEGQLELI